MVELDWLPIPSKGDSPISLSFQFKTLMYATVVLDFQHKTRDSVRFSRKQTFLLIWEDNQWKFDLFQMVRAPFYSDEGG